MFGSFLCRVQREHILTGDLMGAVFCRCFESVTRMLFGPLPVICWYWHKFSPSSATSLCYLLRNIYCLYKLHHD